MNRSILIVICDFLLVSLLAFSTVDLNEAVEQGSPRDAKLDFATNQIDSRQDLAAVMKLALDDERRSRELLLSELARTRETLTQQQTLSVEREKQVQTYQQKLQVEEQQVAAAQTNIQTLQQQLAGTAAEARRLQDERTKLQQQVATAQTNAQALSQQLQSRTAESQRSRDKLAATEADLRKQQDQAAALTRLLGQVERSNQVNQVEKDQLAARLQAAEAEKRFATEQLAKVFDDLKSAREEQARLTRHAENLAENVKALASHSSELAQEIRENRALAANTIFEDFVTNRVHASFTASRSGLLRFDSNRRKEVETVLVTDGTNLFALCHVEDTAVALWNPGTDWESLTGTLNRRGTLFSVRGMSFFQGDPRVVLVPLSAEQARQLGCKVYRIAPEPFKFQDAVLVGAREGYYGECKFQIDLTTPRYVRMDRNLFMGLFGKFNPSRGDLVLSKTGEVLGIMVNNTHCVLIHNFRLAASLRFGQDARGQRTGELLGRLYAQVTQLPIKLQ